MNRGRIHRRVAGWWVVTMILAAPAWSTTPPASMTVEVIPRDQETLIQKMLALPADLASDTGCEVQDIEVQKTSIKARVLCKTAQGSNEWSVDLTHVNAKEATAGKVIKTERFRVAAEEGHDVRVLDQFVEQVKAHEGDFRWVVAMEGWSRPDTDLPSPDKIEGDKDDPRHLRYNVGFEMFKERQYGRAYKYFVLMARDDPTYAGVLGMLVANLAPLHPDAERVKKLTDASDAKPDSALDAFLAGVAAHYSAHYVASSKEGKQALYETAIQYLERTRPTFDFEPRVFIYLAVSHYRLGHQKQAEALIEQAVALNRQDPDAFYCRAEIFHRTQPERALKDIDQYLALTEAEEGVSTAKVNRVRKMRGYLVRVISGELELTELWDPITGHTYEVPSAADVFTDGTWGPIALIVLALMVFLLSFAVIRFRKKSTPDSSS